MFIVKIIIFILEIRIVKILLSSYHGYKSPIKIFCVNRHLFIDMNEYGV